MARYNAAKRRRLLQDPGIISNRLKVDAFIANARAYLEIRCSAGILQRLHLAIYRRQGAAPPASVSRASSRRRRPHSDAMSKDLKQKGFKFVGSTICYAFMQAVGIVNEHQRYCWAAGKEMHQWLIGSRCSAKFSAAALLASASLHTRLRADAEAGVQADRCVSICNGRPIRRSRPMAATSPMCEWDSTSRPTGRAAASGWWASMARMNALFPGAPTSGSPRWSPDGTRIAYHRARARTARRSYSCTGRRAASARPISNFTESPSGAGLVAGRPLACLHHVRAAGAQSR